MAVECVLVGEVRRVGDGHVGRHILKHAGPGPERTVVRSAEAELLEPPPVVAAPSRLRRWLISPAWYASWVIIAADDPAGRPPLAPVRQPRGVELGVVGQGHHVPDEARVGRLEPGQDLGG